MPTGLSIPVPCWTRAVMPSEKDAVVTDVRWWLTFQKAFPGEKNNIQQACVKK
jgi:hypothetical protein